MEKKNLTEELQRLEFAFDLIYDWFGPVRLAARMEVKKLWPVVFGEEIGDVRW